MPFDFIKFTPYGLCHFKAFNLLICRMEYKENAPISTLVRILQTPMLLASVMLVGANAFVLSPILADVAHGLSSEPFRIAWSISAFGAATAISALTLASLNDRMPAGIVLGSAAWLLAIAQAWSGMSQGWIGLCLSQALAGIATGVLLPGTYATTAAIAPRGREAARLGLVLTGWAMALVLAVPLAAFVTQHIGWRSVYALLAGMSALIALGLMWVLRGVPRQTHARTPPWRALRLPGVGPLLGVMFAYMTAFYGSFAFFGQGVRHAFELSAQGAGGFVMAYGLGFGMAGAGLGVIAPTISRAYLLSVLFAIAVSYGAWGYALVTPASTLMAAFLWGLLNQLGLNALVVSLNRRAAEARGAVMGLNSAVTYSAVFAGPVMMGPVYTDGGFTAVTALAAVFVVLGALASWKLRMNT